MNSSTISVLFVSRRNTIRSIIAQSCLAHLSKGRFSAYSCGMPNEILSNPNEVALRALDRAKIPMVQSKCIGWDIYVRNGAPRMQWVIVLDKNVKRMEPLWAGQPESALWHQPDVLEAKLNAAEATAQASNLLFSLYRRLEILTNLPMKTGDHADLRADVRDLGYLV